MLVHIRAIGSDYIDAAARKGRTSRIVSDRIFGSFRERATELDDSLSEQLLPILRTNWPLSYSEESLRFEIDPARDERLHGDALWILDPLDGTDELVAGNFEGCALLTAFVTRTSAGRFRPAAAVVHQPCSSVGSISWSGVCGEGVTYTRPDGSVTVYPARIEDGGEFRVSSPVRCYVRKSDPRPRLMEFYRGLENSLGRPIEIVMTGGAGAAFSEILADAVNGRPAIVCYNVDYTKEWDVAAGDMLLGNLGGWTSDLCGEPFTYNRRDPFNRRGFIACVGVEREILLQAIPSDLVEVTTGGC